MNWTDLVVLIIIGSITAAEAKRGLGPALFTVAGALLSARLALLWSGPVSGSLRLTANPGQNQAWALFLLFALLMTVVLAIIHVMHPETMISADPFDGPLGAICGFFTGCAVAFVFYRGLGFWGARDLLQSSLFAPEILHQRTYHAIVRGLYGLGDAQNERLNIK